MITTVSPALPELGVTATTLNPLATVKLTPLLAVPPTNTTTLPVVAPVGTGTTIALSLQLTGAVVVPLNLRVLDPWLDPNPAPVTVTVAPIPPSVGVRLEMPGPEFTVNGVPELASPDAVTTTLPEVAPEGTGATMLEDPQLDGVVSTPLKETVPDP